MAQQFTNQQLMDSVWGGMTGQSRRGWERNNEPPRRVMSELGAASLRASIQRLFPDGLPPLEEPTPPQCGVCGDSGLVHVNAEAQPGDSDFGKLRACTNPDCERAKRDRADWLERVQQVALRNSDFADSYKEFTFASFGELLRQQHGDDWRGKKGGYAVAAMFAVAGGQPFTKTAAAQSVGFERFPSDDGKEHRNVVLFGEAGYGKTALAAAAFNMLIANGQRSIFTRTADVVARIQATYGDDGKTDVNTKALIEMYANVPYLILDEFAFQSYTPDRLEKIEEIVRGRDRQQLPTLYTTNTRLEQIDALWDIRIADMVRKAHWVQVAGVKLRVVSSKPAETW